MTDNENVFFNVESVQVVSVAKYDGDGNTNNQVVLLINKSDSVEKVRIYMNGEIDIKIA